MYIHRKRHKKPCRNRSVKFKAKLRAKCKKRSLRMFGSAH